MLRGLSLVLILLAVLPQLPATAEPAQETGDFLELIESIRVNIPGRDSEGFSPPGSTDLATWRMIMDAMLEEDFDSAESLLETNFPGYEFVDFVDTGLDTSRYWILMETPPIALGWGTVILRLSHLRDIAVEVPHPRYEINTPSEGADIFRRIGARLFIMAGTHRCANSQHSPCDGTSTVCGDADYHVSDMGHFVEAAYQTAHEAFTDRYPQGYSFSIHGTGRSECEDIFLSNGHSTDSRQVLYDLRDHMLGSGGITVGVAGDGSSDCTLYGTTNAQGRYTNGSLHPCTQACDSTTGHFIHAEQQRRVRDDISVYIEFINAIIEAFPATQAGIGIKGPAPVLSLTGPCPNPGQSVIRFSLAGTGVGKVRVEAFDVLGRSVALLYYGPLSAERAVQVEFDAAPLASGIYFVRATSGSVASTRAVTVLK